MKKYLAALLIIISAFFITSCKQEDKGQIAKQEETVVQESPDSETVANEEVKLQEEIDEVGVYPGMIAPELVLNDKDDNEIKLSDYGGKIVFLNFWATTCPYCVYEMPDLEEFYQNHKDDLDFELLGVNMTKTWEKQSKDELIKWVDEEGINFPVVYDVDGVEANRWMAHSLPVTYIIDKDGRSLGALMGKTTLDVFENVLEEVRNK